MKKRMYWSQCITAILVALVTAALTLWPVYGLLVRQARGALANDWKLIAQSIDYAGPDGVNYLLISVRILSELQSLHRTARCCMIRTARWPMKKII